VLRNLCYGFTSNGDETVFSKLVEHIQRLFGVEIEKPEYVPARGELSMTYRDQDGVRLDLSASGRGLQQTLLLLAYLYANPGAVVLLDEPDAHLEVLRQRQTYDLITEVAAAQGGQIIAASHSEVVLNEAAGRHMVIAFVGRPHRIDDRGSQVLKSLTELGYDQYYQAEQMGWVLYLEGATDLVVLKAFAEVLEHPAAEHLAKPFVHYVGNNVPKRARDHFHGLREALPNLRGIALFDRIDNPLDASPPLEEHMWQKREIENYLFYRETLLAYAEAEGARETPGPLFAKSGGEDRRGKMDECISDLVPPVALRNADDPWWRNEKASAFLDRLFDMYFAKLGLPNIMRKADYHELARLVPATQIDDEVTEKLDVIQRVAASAISFKLP
jgi:hypothetical protein